MNEEFVEAFIRLGLFLGSIRVQRFRHVTKRPVGRSSVWFDESVWLLLPSA